MILKRYQSTLILLIIISVAAFFRFYRLSYYPAGLFPDEAANGLDVNSIFNGIHSPFFERGNGREALFFYLIALSFKIFGFGIWQIHLVSATVGVLSVLGIYLVAKHWFNQKIAYLSSFLASVSIPAIVMSRVGFRAVMITATMTYFFYFASLALKQSAKHSYRHAALAGLFFGLNLYTYISSRVLSLVIFFLILTAGLIDWRLGFGKNFLLKYKKQLIIGIAAALVTLIPLINYFWNSPKAFIGRAGHVSVFNPDLNQGSVAKTLLLNFKKTVLMFGWQGDLNWRHNVSGQPFFDKFTAALFYSSVIYLTIDTFANLYLVLIKKRRSVRIKLFIGLALWTWLLGGIMPMALTAEGIPHFLRAQGIIPIVFVLPAWLIYQLFSYLKNRKFLNKTGLNIILAGFAIYLFINSFYIYFIYAYNQPENFYAFRSDLTIVSDYLNQRNDRWHTFLVLDEFSVQTVKFLTLADKQPYQLVKPELAYAWDYDSSKQIINRQTVVVFTQSTIFDTIKFKQIHPEAGLIEAVKNSWGQTVMEVYELE